MAKIQSIRNGESLPFVFDRGGESTDGFICTISVKQFPDDVAAISRIIPLAEGGESWDGFLTSTETSGLAEGLWYMNADLVNAEFDEEEAIPVRFTIAVSWT